MKKIIHFSLLFLITCCYSFGQTQNSITIHEDVYNQLKSNNQLDSSLYYHILSANNQSGKTGYTPGDTTFLEAIPPSDDGSSAELTLPFDFCFFGEPKTKVFINSNGNISFENPFSTSAALTFPFNNFEIIAPFWADVDTRKKGRVLYKLTSTSLIVSWEDVGHFNQDSIRGNSFQLVMTNGSDPILPQGYNLAFYYDDIQWTAGSASGGVNGFGGASAAVGANKGNNVDFLQLGRFDNPSFNYDGPYNSNDGAFWLNDRSIFIDICSSDNIAPVFTGKDLADTISICAGEDFNLKLEVLSPESGQTTSIIENLNGFSLGNLIQDSAGNVAVFEYFIPANPSLQGFYNFTFGAFDNGVPSKSSNFNIVIEIGDSLSTIPVLEGVSRACGANQVPLKVVPSTFDSYSWSTGDNTDSINVGIGTYQVTVVDGSCEVELSYSVTSDPYQPNIMGPDYICFGDTFILSVDSVSTDSTYLWSNGSIDSSTTFFNPGVHSVTVTEFGGCVGIDSIEVKVLGLDSFSIITSSDTSCNGALVTLSTGFAFDSILWNTFQTIPTITGDSGRYIVGVAQRDINGNFCFDIDSVDIAIHTYPLLSISGDTSFCEGGSTQLEVDSVYDAYLWDNSTTTQTANYSLDGIHSVIARSLSCFDTLEFELVEKQNPVPDISGGQYYCPGGDSVALNSGFGVVWDSVMWSTGAISPFINVINGSYTLTVYKDGCSGSDVHVVDTLGGSIEIIGDSIWCPEGTILNAGLGFDSYSWSNGDTTRLTTKVGPGSYSVTVTLGTCSAVSDTIIIDSASLVSVHISGDTVQCDGQGGIISVPFGFVDYTWNDGQTNSGIFVDTSGIYSVTVNDTNGCEIVDSVNVVVNSSPVPLILGDTITCNNDSIQLQIQDYPSILWSTGDTTTAITVQNGTFGVVVIDSSGCIGEFQNFQVFNGSPTASIFGDTLACDGDTLQFYAIASDSIMWFNGETSDTINVDQLQVSLTVSDSLGCSNIVSFQAQSFPIPTADFSISPDESQIIGVPVEFTDQSSISSGSIVRWNWDFGDSVTDTIQNTTHSYGDGGEKIIRLTVQSDSGCIAFTEIPYEIFVDIVAVNIMTPNGDFINDFLVFNGLELYPGSKLQVFNRWGELMYDDNNYRNNWDGYAVSDGTYFYILKLGGDGRVIKGTFLITR